MGGVLLNVAKIIGVLLEIGEQQVRTLKRVVFCWLWLSSLVVYWSLEGDSTKEDGKSNITRVGGVFLI